MKNKDQERLKAYIDEETLQTPRQFQWRTFRAFLSEILVHKLTFLGSCLLVLLVTAATVIQPLLFGHAVDHAILPKNLSLLGTLAWIFLAVEVARFFGNIGSNYLFTELSQRVMQTLRVRLLDRIQRFPLGLFDETASGKLVTRVTNDVASLSDMFTAGLISMAQNILVVGGTLVSLLWIDLRTGLVALALMPFLLLVSLRFSNWLREAYKRARARLAALNSFLAETLNGMRVVQLHGLNQIFLDRYQTLNRWYADSQFGTTRVYALFHPSITLASGFSMVFVILYGSQRVQDGSLTLGNLIAILTYTVALYQPFRDIADKWNVFLSGMVSAERVFQILQWPIEQVEISEKATAPSSPAGGSTAVPRVRFENVWFAYKNEDWVLQDLSFEIPAGSFVGIVGPTGSGKTTLISLLLRFYEPQRGRIWIGDREIRDIPRTELRALFGLIQQEGFLFSGSVRENLSLWREPRQEVETAVGQLLSLSHPNELLSRRLDERGSNLSMGERQILAFARALYQDPKIWILDEATANVDTLTEEKLEHHLRTHSKERTLFVIAHRLSSLKKSDQILVLNKGHLIERGSHSDLMKAQGLYSKLFRVQESAFQLSHEAH